MCLVLRIICYVNNWIFILRSPKIIGTITQRRKKISLVHPKFWNNFIIWYFKLFRHFSFIDDFFTIYFILGRFGLQKIKNKLNISETDIKFNVRQIKCFNYVVFDKSTYYMRYNYDKLISLVYILLVH